MPDATSQSQEDFISLNISDLRFSHGGTGLGLCRLETVLADSMEATSNQIGNLAP